MRLFIAHIVVATLLASCATRPPYVIATSVSPAKYSEATKLRRVAVIPLDGPRGDELTSEIESLLVSTRIDEKPYFTVVERDRINEALRELKLSNSALTDENTAVRIGKILGAQAIYMGRVNKPRSFDRNYSEQRSVCAYQTTKYDKKGREYQTCGGYRNYSVNCTERNAEFTIIPKIVEVATTKIVYANTITRKESSSACSDRGTLLSSEELIANARKGTLADLKTHIAPHYSKVRIDLLEERGGMGKEALTMFDKGLEYAKHSRFDRACELWREAHNMSSGAPSLAYSVGVCAELEGNHHQALNFYKKADRLLNNPNQIITTALNRANDQIKKQSKLEEQVKSKAQ